MESLHQTIQEIRTGIKNWWAPLILGVLFIAVGLLVFVKPLASYVSLAIFFAASMLLSGIFQIVFAVANRQTIEGWGWQLTLGIMELFLGIVLFANLEFTMAVLPFYVGFWLLFRAFALMGFSFELKSYKVMDWGYYLVFGILLGVLSWFIILNPVFGGLTIVSWTGIALIVAGIAHIVLAFRLKKINKKIIQVENKFKV